MLTIKLTHNKDGTMDVIISLKGGKKITRTLSKDGGMLKIEEFAELVENWFKTDPNVREFFNYEEDANLDGSKQAS